MATITFIICSTKQLAREKHQLQQELKIIKNQLCVEQTKAITTSASIKRMKVRCKLIEKQTNACIKAVITKPFSFCPKD
jgi:hypothetical protein